MRLQIISTCDENTLEVKVVEVLFHEKHWYQRACAMMQPILLSFETIEAFCCVWPDNRQKHCKSHHENLSLLNLHLEMLSPFHGSELQTLSTCYGLCHDMVCFGLWLPPPSSAMGNPICVGSRIKIPLLPVFLLTNRDLSWWLFNHHCVDTFRNGSNVLIAHLYVNSHLLTKPNY